MRDTQDPPKVPLMCPIANSSLQRLAPAGPRRESRQLRATVFATPFRRMVIAFVAPNRANTSQAFKSQNRIDIPNRKKCAGLDAIWRQESGPDREFQIAEALQAARRNLCAVRIACVVCCVLLV